jgi:hypothetical protein
MGSFARAGDSSESLGGKEKAAIGTPSSVNLKVDSFPLMGSL